MDEPRKATPQKTGERWQLSQKLGIPEWQDCLTLPQSDLNHDPALLELERCCGFTAVIPAPETGDTPVDIFVSEKTDLLSLCKRLPFLFKFHQVYLCADALIQQRLATLSRDSFLDHDNVATKNLSYLLEKAAIDNASDIHIESQADEKLVRLRIDGLLIPIEMPEDVDDRLFTKIKLHAGMDIAQKRLPQDGHFQFISSQGARFDLRVSTVPGINGEKIVIRLLPTSSVEFSLKETGFSDTHIKQIQSSLAAKTGMILFTGPTGSGKTTSLYSILKELQSESLNIMTIEDPVEYRLKGITQVEVNALAGIGFASALRSFLRQDPDVLLVGEIRDSETAQIAARAAQTGHLVLSTLHSNNVFEAIHRLATLGVRGDDIASSLKLLVSQRLVPLICACGGDSNCGNCFGKGVSGRKPVLEMLPVSSTLKKMLSYAASVADIEAEARNSGFVSMREYGMTLVKKNHISLAELDSVCPETN